MLDKKYTLKENHQKAPEVPMIFTVSNVLFINEQDLQRSMRFYEYVKALQAENNVSFSETELKNGRSLKLKRPKIFYTDDNNDPNVFEFEIESCGVLKP